ncbi:hypothetical protein [Novosphingobium sp.]|uniref:hypothetical protein n=1 Tax=Novosphingobium sp. TaxID=1874826 RepID=UPI003D14D2B2
MTDATDQPDFGVTAFLAAVDSGTLGDFLLQAFIGQDWAALIADAAQLHAQGSIDLLELARLQQDAVSSYGITRFFCQILPQLTAPTQVMVPLLCGFKQGSDQNETALEAFEAISKWCAVAPQRCREAYAGIGTDQFEHAILRECQLAPETVILWLIAEVEKYGRSIPW